MSLASLLRDLLLFSVQGVVVAAISALLSRMLPIERPAQKLAWWQGVLLVTLALPFLGSWAGVPVGSMSIQFATGGPTSTVARDAMGSDSWTSAVAAVLAMGVLVRMVRLGRGAARLRTCRARSTPFATPALLGLEAAVGAQAEVRLSPDVEVPATFGLRRPLVLLPQSVRDLPDERQRAIVAHELIHVRRRDWPFAVAEEAISAALWFHPAVHFLLGRIRLAREQCVDAAVVETLGDRTVYLESLLEMARRRLRPELVPAALFLGERHLSERVEFLLKEAVMSKVKAVSHLLVSASVLVLTGAVVSSSLPLSTPAESENEAKTATTDKAKAGEPRLVHKVSPIYPPEAKKDHVQGVVHIDTRLAKDGSVAEATATDGHPILAEAALTAVRQWRYEPVLGPDKKPIELKLTITINFRLDE